MKKKFIALSTAAFLLFGLSSQAIAADNQTPTDAAGIQTLTLDDAIALSLTNSIDIKKSELTLQASQKNRDDAWENSNAFMANTQLPGGGYISVSSNQDPTGLVYSTEFNARVNAKDLDTAKETLVMKVFQQYYKVINDSKDLEVKNQEYIRDSKKLQIAKIKFQFGMESNVGLVRAQAQEEVAKTAKSMATNTLDQDYRVLNDLIGLDENSKPQLTDDLEYKPLVLENVEVAIDKVVAASPALYKAEEAVKLQENTMGFSSNYNVDRINLKKANETVSGTKLELKKGTRNLYFMVLTMEDNLATLEANLLTAEDALRVTQLNKSLGMATELDVVTAEAAVTSLKQKIYSTKVQHEVYANAFYKPWSYSMN